MSLAWGVWWVVASVQVQGAQGGKDGPQVGMESGPALDRVENVY